MPPSEAQSAHGTYESTYFYHTSIKHKSFVNRDAAAARSSPCHVFDKQFQRKCRHLNRKVHPGHTKAHTFNTRTHNATNKLLIEMPRPRASHRGMFLIGNSKENAANKSAKGARNIWQHIFLIHEHKMPTKTNTLVNRDAAAARSWPCHVFYKQFQNKMPPSEAQSAQGTYEGTHF